MTKYTRKDLWVIKKYGREELFNTGFGGRTPSCNEVIAATLDQMVYLDCQKIFYMNLDEYHVFASDDM